MVAVLFFYTARDEAALLDTPEARRRPSTSWASSGAGTSTTSTSDVYESGVQAELDRQARRAEETAADARTCPVNKRVEFVLNSRDVIHSFWVPAFLQKLDMIPGKTNRFQVVPTADRAPSRASAPSCAARTTRRCCSRSRSCPRPSTTRTSPSWARGQTGQLDNDLTASGHARGQELRPEQAAARWHATDDDLDHRSRSTELHASGHSRASSPGQTVVKWITTTDHKVIGNLYLITSFVFFMIGGVMALLIRAELVAAGPAGRRQPRAVQPAVHHARHDHAAAVRDAAVRRLRQRDHAAADRRAGRRVPAAEHVRLLAVPVRRPDRRGRLPHPAGRGVLRLVRLRAAVGRSLQPRARRGPVGLRPGAGWFRHHPRCGQLHHHDHLHARPGHDDVPDADLHLDDPGHLASWC